jgi:hypothetical protein
MDPSSARLAGIVLVLATAVRGGGMKFHLDDRVYVIGEMRLRGIAENFSGSTAEWLGGIGWKLW